MNRLFCMAGWSVVALTLANGPATLGQTSPIEWLPTGTDNWNVPGNWEDVGDGNNVPAAEFDEIAVINNSGTAQVTDTPPDVGGIELGPGGLEILSGGNLTAAVGQLTGSAQGAIVVAASGTLSVASGGALAAQSASSAGTIRITGPTATFNLASGFSLSGSSNLVADITSGTHSAISVGGNATLGGSLRLEFDGVIPSVGDRYDILDVGEVGGAFETITAPGVTLGRGQTFGIQQEPGGTNGLLVQAVFEQRLVMTVDRETGIAAIENPGADPINIDLYFVESAVGSIDPGGWDSFADQGLAGNTWQEAGTGGTPNTIAELNPDTFSSLGASSMTPIGSIFEPNFLTLGQETEDLTFTYALPTGEELEGFVEYVGDKQYNNIVLTVDPESGEATMQNESEISVSIDGYTITSADNGLLSGDGNWNSLEDQGAAGGDWFEVGSVGPGLLSELQRDGTTTLNTGDGFNLGAIFDTSTMQELEFEFLIAGDTEFFPGVVVFGELPTLGGFAADFDGDGDVDGDDFLLWQGGFGIASGAMKDDGDADDDGDVDGDDFLVWQSEFGSGTDGGSSTAVPEPASGLLWVLAAVVLLLPSRRPS